MSPLADKQQVGLSGFGQVHFPAGAIAYASELGLTSEADIYSEQFVDDGAGGSTRELILTMRGVPARIDPLGGGSRDDTLGEQVSERSDHLVSLPAGTPVGTGSVVVLEGTRWAVEALRTATDGPLQQVEVTAE